MAKMVMLAHALAAAIVLAALVEVVRSIQPELLRASVRLPVQDRTRRT